MPARAGWHRRALRWSSTWSAALAGRVPGVGSVEVGCCDVLVRAGLREARGERRPRGVRDRAGAGRLAPPCTAGLLPGAEAAPQLLMYGPKKL